MDLQKEIDDLRTETSELRSQLAAKDSVIEAHHARIKELDALIEKLSSKVTTLTKTLGQHSGNSHFPPSSDGPGARSGSSKTKKEPGKKSKSKRKRGGQPGHKGHKRTLLPVEQVANIVDIFPKECTHCWTPLAEDAAALRYQVTEVPPLSPKTTELRRHFVLVDTKPVLLTMTFLNRPLVRV